MLVTYIHLLCNLYYRVIYSPKIRYILHWLQIAGFQRIKKIIKKFKSLINMDKTAKICCRYRGADGGANGTRVAQFPSQLLMSNLCAVWRRRCRVT